MPQDMKASSSRTTPPDQYDPPWKEVASRFFRQLVAFFAADLHARIDWSAPYEFLEQELREVLRDTETGPRRVDKVVKVKTLDGKPLYLVLHIEIQVSRESGFPQRMFIYYIRLYDLFPEAVESLAILGDEDPDWQPEQYEHKQGETTKATRGDASERLRWKVELVRQLYGRGYSREDVHQLFRLLDWLLALPKEMETSFRERLGELEQESKMKYVTSIERMSREEGRKEGYLELLVSQAEEKFGPLDESLRKTIREASVEQIMDWAKRLLRASSVDEVFAT